MGIFYSTASTQTTRIVYVKDETTSKYNELTRKVEFGFSYLGLSLNLVKKSFIEFYSGASASIGKTYIITSQDDGDMRFNDLWDLSNEHKRTFNYSAWSYFFEGYSGFRYYLAKGIAIDVRASYLDVIVSKEGEINNGFETVSNVPSLDFKSIVYSLSIYFGN